MAYCPEKSNVTAEQLERFLNCSINDKVDRVPGIGKVSVAILKKEGISTINDLFEKIDMSEMFKYLKSILPRVNVHKIFFSMQSYKDNEERSPLLEEDFDSSAFEDLNSTKERCIIT